MLQIQLTGFLDKDTAKFCRELWLLCLSAQSNPQGVPKELLEAKKLELIQEKVGSFFTLVEVCAHVYSRLKPKRLPKKLSAAKSRKSNETAISRAFAKESEANEVEAVVVAEAAETIMITIGGHHEIRDRLLLDGEAHRVSAALHPAVTSILIFLLVGVAVDQMKGGVGHPLQRDQIHILDRRPEPRHVEDIAMVTPLDHGDGNIPQVDLERLPAGVDMAEIGIEGDQDAVMIEQDP